MICGSADVDAVSSVGSTSVVETFATLTKTNIRDGNIIQDKSTLDGSKVGNNNLIEVGCLLRNCTIGDSNEFQSRCKLSHCVIGNHCMIGAEVVLDGVTLADQTSVFVVNGELKTLHNERTQLAPLAQMYRNALSDPSSVQCISKNHVMKSS
jgi:carbonic anhydrase/acetyltransferase-like protein (isoleucine patch superfamily)